MRWLKLIRLQILCWISVSQCNSIVYGQSEKATPEQSIKAGLASLTSQKPDDWKVGEQHLQKAMQVRELREKAMIGLALYHIKRGNLKAVTTFCSKSTSLFPENSAEVRLQLSRIQLWQALASNDANRSSEHFSVLLSSLQTNVATPSGKVASAACLGAVVGMLESNPDQSLIPAEITKKAKAILAQSEPASLGKHFTSHSQRTSAQSKEISVWLLSHADLSKDEVKQIAAAEAAEVGERLSSIISDGRSTLESLHTAQKNLRDTKIEHKNTERKIQAVQSQWNSHPELHNPVEPNRDAVARSGVVPTTHRVKTGTKRVRKYKTDRNGKKVEDGWEEEDVYRDRPRPQADIDRDINNIYQNLLNQYNRLMQIRTTLLQNRQQLDAYLQEKSDTITSTEAEQDSLEQTNKELATELKEVQAKASLLNRVLVALSGENPSAAFQPPTIEILDYALERKVLSE